MTFSWLFIGCEKVGSILVCNQVSILQSRANTCPAGTSWLLLNAVSVHSALELSKTSLQGTSSSIQFKAMVVINFLKLMPDAELEVESKIVSLVTAMSRNRQNRVEVPDLYYDFLATYQRKTKLKILMARKMDTGIHQTMDREDQFKITWFQI